MSTTQTDGTIALTDSATAKIAELIQQEGTPIWLCESPFNPADAPDSVTRCSSTQISPTTM